MPKSMQLGHQATHARVCQARDEFARLGNASGTMGTHRCCQYRTCKGGCTTRRRRRGGPAEKASMAVAGAEEGEVEGANACCCWSRRSSRGRDGDAGDVVVLDEVRKGTQIFQHKAE